MLLFCCALNDVSSNTFTWTFVVQVIIRGDSPEASIPENSIGLSSFQGTPTFFPLAFLPHPSLPSPPPPLFTPFLLSFSLPPPLHSFLPSFPSSLLLPAASTASPPASSGVGVSLWCQAASKQQKLSASPCPCQFPSQARTGRRWLLGGCCCWGAADIYWCTLFIRIFIIALHRCGQWQVCN